MQECYQKGYSAFSTATPLLDYNSTSDNLFTHMPIMDNARMPMGVST